MMSQQPPKPLAAVLPVVPAPASEPVTSAGPIAAHHLAHCDVWVFDLDNTLYPATCNLFAQVDVLIGQFVQEHLQVDAVEARRLQKQYFREHGTTLCGLMRYHGVQPAAFLDYVHKIDVTPVPPSPALDAALRQLPGRKLIFTNGSVGHAENVMNRLGVAHHFDGVFDIVAADYRPKPDPETYRSMLKRHGVDPRAATMFEDLPGNLRPAAALGMTTVLVKTDAEWAQDGADGDHIHHVTEDLVTWLEANCPPSR
jgi:putative hydrolase of the HAD superfamily